MSGFHFGKLPFDCPSVNLEINSVNEGSFAAGSTINLTLTDGTNPVTPESVTVVGNDVEVEVSAGAAPSGRELMKTGQKNTYRTGDDGDLQEGRDVDEFILDYTNPFGNTNRFTDELGGTAYANDWAIDWSTYNAVSGKVLGYFRILQTANTWDNAIDLCLSGTFGTFTGCRLPNINELHNAVKYQLSPAAEGFLYTPLNLPNGVAYWSSTTRTQAPSTAYLLVTGANFQQVSQPKTNNRNYIPVRTFTLSGTTLT
jgi:hypothetical protein